ncbi:MAG TPA: NAD(P)/FAD-dependent oxidoreductase [Azospirillaceae bacterium]|nr:NAD(P)/FAD-dependent oxidoreductase [Azospirillaceae bacterium]
MASPSSGAPHVVIVGAGFAGLATARTLGSSSETRVTVIDRRNYHLFVPLLYQVATATLSPADIAEPIRHILWRHENVEVRLGEVTGVDVVRREVILAGGDRVPYDYLVLATGSSQSYFGHPGWERFAPGLKTIEDAREIRARVLMNFELAENSRDPEEQRRLLTIVIVGGGPTGVEMAGALAELTRRSLARDFRHINPRTASIMLVEAGPRILPTFPEELSAYAKTDLEGQGVTVLTNTAVEDVTDKGVVLRGSFYPAGAVIWGAGVAASPAGRWLGVETDRAGRVKVAADLSVPGLSNVYVLGDTALAEGDDGTPLPGLAQVAKQQGEYLGRALLKRIRHGAPPEPFRFKSRGNTAIVGRNAAVFDFGRRRFKGLLAWLLWGIVHVFLLVGFENRVVVSIQWLWAYLTDQRGARLITAERKMPPEPAAKPVPQPAVVAPEAAERR